MIKPIETHYKGYRFRSRLEARWAVFFDYLGVNWQYEKEGYDLEGIKYLPDFWIDLYPIDFPDFHGWGYWVEIKPREPTEEEMIKAQLLAKATNHTVYIIWGDCKDSFRAVVFVHGTGEIRVNHGWYQDEVEETRIGLLWDCCFIDEYNNKAIMPFWYYLKCTFRPDLKISSAFSAFRSARFEHDNYTPA